MTDDREFGRTSQHGEFGSSGGVDDPAWRIDWDRVRTARLVGDRERPRSNGTAVEEPAAARPAPPAARPADPAVSSSSPAPSGPQPVAAHRATPLAAQPPAPRRARRPQRRALLILLGAVLLLAAGAGAVVVLVDRFEDDTPEAPSPPSREPGAQVDGLAQDGPSDLRREYPARRTFVTGGVRFKVTSEPQQLWTQGAATVPPGEGRAWHSVAVLYRNISRRSLTAESLRFRLRDARGALYSPSARLGNRGTELPPGAQIPAGTLIHGQLAFRVQQDSGPYALLIDASPSRRVRVEFAPG